MSQVVKHSATPSSVLDAESTPNTDAQNVQVFILVTYKIHWE